MDHDELMDSLILMLSSSDRGDVELAINIIYNNNQFIDDDYKIFSCLKANCVDKDQFKTYCRFKLCGLQPTQIHLSAKLSWEHVWTYTKHTYESALKNLQITHFSKFDVTDKRYEYHF